MADNFNTDCCGNVKGTTQTAVDRSGSTAQTVAKASYDPGYTLGNSMGDAKDTDLRYGYTHK